MKALELNDLWRSSCVKLQEILHPDIFNRWIAVIQPVECSESTLVLAVDNDFYQEWLEENYLPLIKNAVTASAGEEFKIRFVIQPRPELQEQSLEDKKEKPRRKTIRERLGISSKQISSPLNAKYTFDEFIVGPCNNFAHAACLAVAQAPARAYNPLFIYGSNGLGKTHLMHAIGHHILSDARASVRYISCETMLNEYIAALQGQSMQEFRKAYRNTDILLIDDIHFLAGKNALQEEFFHTFNALFDARKQIVMTSDRPATEIARLEKRLVTRFEWGLVTEIEPLDLETRIAILRHKMDNMKATLPDEIINFIAENVRSNVRPIEGALVRAISYASLTGRPLTIDSLKHLLRDTLENEKQEEITFDVIQRTVAEHYDVRLSDMTSKRRPREVAAPRQLAMYLCRKMTRSSLPDIANAFRKTHATILHACKTVENRMDVDPELRDEVRNISTKLGKRLI